MAVTYDISTDTGKVRLLITDTDTDNPIFTDEEIAVFLSQTAYSGANDIYYAAAEALDVIARSKALIGKVKLLDLDIDGPITGNALMKMAQRLRDKSDADVEIDWAEWGLTAANKSEIIYNDALRDE